MRPASSVSSALLVLLFLIMVHGQVNQWSNERLNKNLNRVSCSKNPAFGELSYTGGKMCLFWSAVPKTFADAKADCEARGARLAVFKGADKMAFVTSHLSIWLRDLWIGLDDIQNEGTFVWHDGTILYKHEYHPLYFTGDNPDNYQNQDCVYLAAYSWKLDDSSCSKGKNYVCEKVL